MMNTEWEGRDSSGFGNHATATGVTFTIGPTGEDGTAYRFYGRASSHLLVKGSQSMDVGANGSFAFTAFVNMRSNKKTGAFIDFNHPDAYALHVWSHPDYNLFLNMPERANLHHIFQLTNLSFISDAWHFVGVSYDITTGKVIGLVDNKTAVESAGNHTVATNTPVILLGGHSKKSHSYLLGDMSCAMLFSVSLSVDDMKRAKKYCMKQARPYGKSNCQR